MENNSKKIIIILGIAIVLAGIIFVIAGSDDRNVTSTNTGPTEEFDIDSIGDASFDEVYKGEKMLEKAFKINDKLGFTLSYPERFAKEVKFGLVYDEVTNTLYKVVVKHKKTDFTIFTLVVNHKSQEIKGILIGDYTVTIELGFKPNINTDDGKTINEIQKHAVYLYNYIKETNLKNVELQEAEVVTDEDIYLYTPVILDTPTQSQQPSEEPGSLPAQGDPNAPTGTQPNPKPNETQPQQPNQTEPATQIEQLPMSFPKYPVPEDGKYEYYTVKNQLITLDFNKLEKTGVMDNVFFQDNKYYTHYLANDGQTIYVYKHEETNAPTYIHVNKLIKDIFG